MTTTRSNSTILFEYPPDKKINSTRGHITFTTHDQRQLRKPRFFNDTIISFFMQYYLDNVRSKTKNRIHLFSSFFYPKIKSVCFKEDDGESYRCLSRWLRGVKIFSKDFLIMPVCEDDHWALVIICYPAETSKDCRNIPDHDLRQPAVLVLNSYYGYHIPKLKRTLRKFLEFQWHAERNSVRNFRIESGMTHKIRLINPDLPQQKNEYDCGIFIINYFRCFLKNIREAYLRFYRRKDMSGWFLAHEDVCLTRQKMDIIINEQIELWNNSGSKDKQEILDASTSENCSLPVETKDHRDDSVIVINIA